MTGGSLGPTSFTTDPVDPFTLYSYSWGRVISRDGGQNWRLVNDEVPNFTVDPMVSGRLHGLGPFSESVDRSVTGLSSRARPLLRSDDYGETWHEVGEAPGGIVLPSPVEAREMYSGSASRYDSETGTYALASHYHSIDGGRTWDTIDGNHIVLRFFINPFRSGGLYGVHGDSVLYSEDYGRTWEHRGCIPSPWLYDLQVHAQQDGLLFMPSGGREAYRSTDGGYTWPPFGPPFANLFSPNPYYLKVDASDPSRAYMPAYDYSTGSTRRILLRTTNSGQTWKEMAGPQGAPGAGTLRFMPDGTLLVGAMGRNEDCAQRPAIATTSDGNSWDWRVGGANWDDRFAAIDPRDGETLYAPTPWGGYRLGAGSMTAILDEAGLAPERSSLGQNYPNPFNAETLIPYVVGTPARVEARLYNAAGQKVGTLVRDQLPAGSYIAR